jgi:peroxiredoxin-like protein
MTTFKSHRFPVSVEWRGGRLTEASVRGKPSLDIATPPEFKGGLPGVWSPEDLLVAATASCYAVTLVAVAERRAVPLHALEVDGTGHVERRDDGHFGFVAIELRATLETDEETVDEAERTARQTKDVCLVSMALDTPVHLELEVRPRVLALA